jgi:uncharacterized protein YdeI (YjbR/CyaY-like superfamily)
MPPKPIPTDFPTQTFPSAADFKSFLEREHTTAPGLHVKLAKKSCKIPSISAAEAVEVALCYGWIDGRANSIDDTWWTVRYTPRRTKSIWSQKNVGTVARLIEEGRMRPAGLAAVEAAKADGRWKRAYAGPATITEPEDFKAKLAEAPAADAFWKSLNKSERYSALWRIETASVKARVKRVEAIVQMLGVGQKPGDRPSTTKVKTKSTQSGKVGKAVSKAKITTSDTPNDQETLSRRAGLRRRTT